MSTLKAISVDYGFEMKKEILICLITMLIRRRCHNILYLNANADGAVIIIIIIFGVQNESLLFCSKQTADVGPTLGVQALGRPPPAGDGAGARVTGSPAGRWPRVPCRL